MKNGKLNAVSPSVRTPFRVRAARGGRGARRWAFFARHSVLVSALAAAYPGLVCAAPPLGAVPTGGQVAAGQTTIGAPQALANGGTRLDINQQSAQTVINWQTFNIGAASQVNFQQPSASAVALNRVAAGNPSEIYGQLNANGQVFLVNPSGVLISPSGQVNVGAFAASTMNITDQDFLNRNYKFTGGNAGGSVVNQGTITAAAGGYVALLAPQVRNEGVVVATLGTVAAGAGDTVTLQMQGDRLISLKVSAAAIDTLIENKNAIRAPGGTIILAASAANALVKSVVNNSGIIEATSMADLRVAGGQQQKGNVQIAASQVSNTGTITVSGSQAGQSAGDIAIRGGFVSLGGTLNADGDVKGGSIAVAADNTLSLADTVSARGLSGDGGRITYLSGGEITENASSNSSVAGRINGGAISVNADGGIISSGQYAADGGDGAGGRIDISGASVRLLSATLSASGATQGGLVRVGGAFQGGASAATDDAPVNPDPLGPAPAPQQTALPVARFVTRWGATAAIANADQTFINDSTRIDVSARGAQADGGTAVVWSNSETTLLGTINATGGNGGRGGAVEISSHDTLRYVALDNVTAGAGGSVLLDPKNITIGSVTDTRSWTLAAIMGNGYAGSASGQLSLAQNEAFGWAVALNGTGDLLAVGVPQAQSFDGSTTQTGAVRLYGFTTGSSTFGGASLIGVVGKGYTGGSNLNISGLATGDNFGASVSLDAAGDRLAIGAYGTSGGASDGAAYLVSFGSRFTLPVLSKTIAAPAAGSLFGSGVALNAAGDRLAVGALADNAGDGKVYLYNTSTFSAPSLLNTIDGPGGTGYQFGISVALGGTAADGSGNNRLAVGANAGDVVYLYTFANGNFGTPLLANSIGVSGVANTVIGNVSVGDTFGSSVSLSADSTKLAVGSPFDGQSGGTVYGAVRLFDLGANFSTATLHATLGQGYSGSANANGTGTSVNVSRLLADENYGYGVALNGAGTALVVGTPYDRGADRATSGIGAVYLYTTPFATPALAGIMGRGYSSGGGTGANSFDVGPVTKDVAVTALLNNDNFGAAVAFNSDGTLLAVGSPGDHTSAGVVLSNQDTGAVRLYSFTDANYSGAALLGKAGKGYTGGGNLNLSLDTGDKFGASVAMSSGGTLLAVGAPGDDGVANGTTDAGAVRLINISGSGFGSVSSTIGSGYSGGGNLGITLAASSLFGSGVALNGTAPATRLAAGAPGDSGSGGVAANSGSVRLFDISGATPAQMLIIGKGYNGANQVNASGLAAGDKFGSSVALNDTGSLLAAGAPGDSGSKGAVYLAWFSNASYTIAPIFSVLGSGKSGSNDVNVTNLAAGDLFGSGVALSGDGSQLAVGAPGDDAGAGSAYLFTYPSGSGTDGRNQSTIGATDALGNTGATAQTFFGSSSPAGYSLVSVALQAGDNFGSAVALSRDGTHLAVGAAKDDGSGNGLTDSGATYLFASTANITAPGASGVTYASNAVSGLTVSPLAITRLLNAGTDVDLQASNDITVNAAVLTESTATGAFALEAGRSILINADIKTGQGNFKAYANETMAAGVLGANRDIGAGVITMAAGKIVSTAGTADFRIFDGNGRSGGKADSGSISLNDVTASKIDAYDLGTTTGSGIITTGTLTAGGSGVAIELAGQTYTNNLTAGTTLPFNMTGGGNWLIWSQAADYDASARGTAVTSGYGFKEYNLAFDVSKTFGSNPAIQGTGNGVIYSATASIANPLTGTVEKTYDGKNNATLTAGNYAANGGGIDGDTVTLTAQPLSGTYATVNAGSGITVTVSGVDVASAKNGARPVYGYTSTGGSISGAVGKIDPLALAGAAIASANSTYGSALTPGALTFSNVVAGDAVTSKTVSVDTNTLSSSKNPVAGSYTQTASATLTGAQSGNYSFTGFTTATKNYTIDQLALAGAAIASANSTYGSALTPGALSFTNVVAGDTVTSNVAVDTNTLSSSKNPVAGTYTQTASATLTGTDAANYSLTGGFTTPTKNYTIDQLALAGAAIASANSTYGSALTPGALSFTNVVAGDTVTSSKVAVDTNTLSSSKNPVAGTYTQTASATLTGTDAANYSFTGGLTTPTKNYTIDQLALAGAAIASANSTYGSALTPGALSFTNVVAGDTVTSSKVAVDTNTLSSSKNPVAGTYTQTASATLAGTDAANYSLTGGFTTPTKNYTIDQLALAGAAIASANSTYGSALTPGALSFTNVVAGDTVTSSKVAVDTNTLSSSKNPVAGTYTQTASATLTGTDAANYSLTGGFTTPTKNYTIDQLALAGAAIASANSTYGSALTPGALSFTNVVAGDTVTSSKVAVDTNTLSSSKNPVAGTYTQTASATLTGTDAANYSFTGGLTTPTKNYTIDQLALAGAAIASANSTYGSALTPGALSFTNVVAGDTVTSSKVAVDTNTLSSSKNPVAGTYTQTASATLAGTDAANYSLTGGFTTPTKNYTIDQLALAGAAIASANSTYGSALTPGALSFTNVVAGDTVTSSKVAVDTNTLSSSKNPVAGTYTQTASATLAGTDAANYSFTGGFTTVTQNYTINQLALAGAAIASANSTYGSALTPGALSFTNVVAGDTVTSNTVAVDTNTLSSSKNPVAGTYTQTASATLTGTDAANYSFAGGLTTPTKNYTIDQLALAGAAIASANSTYGSALTPGALSFTNVVAGDTVTSSKVAVDTNTLSSSKNPVAGSYTQTASATLTGTDAANYSLTGGFTTPTKNYTIDQLALAGAAIASANSTYGSALTPGALSFTNVVAGDTVTSSKVAVDTNTLSSSKNPVAGSYTQTASATLTGADAANYSLTGGFTTPTKNYTIDQLALAGAAIASANSTYGSALTPGALSFTNVVAGDTVTSSTVAVDTNTLSSSKNPVAGTYTQTASATLTGTDAANYSLTGGFTTPTKNYTIDQLALAGAAIASANSTYGSALTPGALSFTNVVAGDTVTSSTVAVDTNTLSSSKNPVAGTYTQTASATLTGTDAANYSLTGGFTTPTKNYTIDQLALAGAAIASANSTYGSALTPGALSFTNVVAGDTVTSNVSVDTNTLSSSKNPVAGTYTQTASATLTGTDAANYSFAGGLTTPTKNYTIDQLALAGAAIASANSTYGSALTPGALSFTNVVAGDTVTSSTVVVDTNTLSSSKNPVAGTYTQTASATLTGADAANYSLTGGFTTATQNYTIDQLALAGAAIASANSTYGSALTPGALSFTNVVAGDTVTSTVAVDTSTLSSSKNPVAGTYTQTASATLTGADAANYSLTGGFTTPTKNYTIDQLALAGAAIASANSTYGSALTPGALSFTNVVAGDTVTSSTVAVDTNTLSSSKNPVAGTYTQTASATLTGTDAANYSFAGGFTTLTKNYTIDQLALAGAAIASANSTYGSALTPGALSFTNVVAGDTVTSSTVAVDTNTLSSSKNPVAGTYTQTASATLSGTDAANYSFTGGFTTPTQNYTINPLALAGAAIASANSTYGSALTPGALSFTNVVAGDTVTSGKVTVDTNTLSSSKNPVAGTYTQTASATLTGTDAANYSFTGGFTTATQNYTINQLALAGAAIASASSTYGSALTPGALTFGNAVAGDGVTSKAVSVDTAALSSSKNPVAGTYTQTASAALTGADAANYSFAGFTTPTQNYTINQLALTGAAIAIANSTYGSAVTPGALSFGDVVAGDTVTSSKVSVNTSTLSSSKNPVAGSYTQTAGATLTGTDAANYSFTGGFTTATPNYTINPFTLAVTYTGVNKVYDGLTAASVITADNHIGADVVAINRVSAFTDANAANGKTINVTGVSLTGADAANYTVAATGTATANITPAPLSITARDLAKTYGDTVALDGTGGFTSSGLKNGETVGSVTLVSAGAAPTAAVAGSPYAITPSAAAGGTFRIGNYNVTYVNGALTVNRAPLTITADDLISTSGLAFPPFTYKTSGLVNGETNAVINGLTITTPATPTSLPGGYPIVPAGASAANYTISYRNGVLVLRSARGDGEPDAGSLGQQQERDGTAVPVPPGPQASPQITVNGGGVNAGGD